MKVALVHDYLREYGGAERVLEALHEIWPKAPVYVAYYNPAALGSQGRALRGWDIRTSWLQKIPFANKLISPLRILAPMIFESFDLSQYDLVISSCNVYFSKAVIVKPEALHISYIHTPPRYLYGYTTSFNYKKHWWTRIGGEIINHFLRIYDFETSQRPDILVANSKNVQARIKKFYRRDAEVIYPPVEIKKFEIPAKGEARQRQGYFLTVGRLVRGKGIDIVIEACGRLGLSLKVVGTGPEKENLESSIKNKALKNIEFLGQVSDEELAKLYAGAKATIVASEDEDFGIVPVESMAAGTPVIAPKYGGYLETVIDGKTGILYEAGELIEAIKKFEKIVFKPADCQNQAEKFSKERFKKEILDLVKENVKDA
ncbi:glycosyltransferase [Candidatus Daviesbacteria bacterium]|nr:glycosyltransferase [Candidatus Daviesbacteria bacterium]